MNVWHFRPAVTLGNDARNTFTMLSPQREKHNNLAFFAVSFHSKRSHVLSSPGQGHHFAAVGSIKVSETTNISRWARRKWTLRISAVWSHSPCCGFYDGVLLLIAKTNRRAFAFVCVCVCRCLMCLILDFNWPPLSLFHSRGSRKRSSLRFLRAWWLSWIKTSTVLTTTWLRSVHTWPLHRVHRGRGLI